MITRFIYFVLAVAMLGISVQKFENGDPNMYKVAVILFFSFVFFVCIFLSKTFRQNLLLFFISFYIAAFLGNLYLDFQYVEKQRVEIVNKLFKAQRQRLSRIERAKIAKQMGADYDLRMPYDYLIEQLNSDKRTQYYYCPATSVNYLAGPDIFPLSGLPRMNSLLCSEGGALNSFFSDRYGFRNPDQVYDVVSKSPKQSSIALLGDSFAQGSCVPSGADIGGQLRSLGNIAVNFGCSGNGPLGSLAIWEEYAKMVSPGVVVLLYYEGNDLANLSWERTSFLNNYMKKGYSQKLVLREKELDVERLRVLKKVKVKARELASQLSQINSIKAKKMIEEKIIQRKKDEKTNNNNLFRRLATLSHIRQGIGLLSQKKSNVDEYKARLDGNMKIIPDVFKRLKDSIEENKSKLLFVYLPSYRSISTNGKRDFPEREPEDYKPKIVKVLKELDIPVIDFEKFLLNTSDPLRYFPFRMAGHYNEQGYRKLGEVIDRYLSEKKINPDE